MSVLNPKFIADASDIASALSYIPASSGANTDIISLTSITGGIDTVEYITFNPSAMVTSAYGRLWIDDAEGGLNVGMKGGSVTMQVGQETMQRITNNTASPMTDGQAVYISGAVGNRATAALAIANSESTSFGTIGLVTEPISVNGQGYITTEGMVHNLNTSTFTEGDMLYLSAITAGLVTNVKPSTTSHLVTIGFCVRSHSTNGTIYVRISNESRLDELHNVVISSPSAGQALVYNSSTNVWNNTDVIPKKINSVTATTSTATLDFSGTDIIRFTLQSNVTILNITGASDGQRCELEIIQDAVGSRTITWPSNVRFGTDITATVLSIQSNKLDRVVLVYVDSIAKYDVISIVRVF